MSKLVKGVVKAVKSVVKGVKKVFKKITSSTIGKVLLGAAVVFLGGAALGMWNSPFASLNGALAGGSQTAASSVLAGGATTGAAATTTAANVAAANGLGIGAGVGAGTAVGAGIGSTAAATTTAAATSAAASSVVPAAEATAATTTTSSVNTAKEGIINKILSGGKKAAEFSSKHPVLTASALSGVASATSPDEIDILKERQKLEEEERERRRKNLESVGDVNLNMSPRSKKLLRSDGQSVYDQNTGGLIYSRMRGGRV